MNKHLSISFCTVSMNRAQHVMQTLPVNIADNKDYPNLEFVLLDYNSSDGLEQYVKENFSEHLKSGILKYYRTGNPEYFHRSHSRNLLFKLAEGDIICNVDADNFTGKNFAEYINNMFGKNRNIFLTTLQKTGTTFRRDVMGRICVNRNDFYRTGGFDERMASYGFEDYDLANRLEMAGVKRACFENGEYFKAIQHQQAERLSNEFISRNLHSILIRYISPSTSDFLFLFKTGNFQRGIIVNNNVYRYEQPLNRIREIEFDMGQKHSILEYSWTEGSWGYTGQSIELNWDSGNGERLEFTSTGKCFSGAEDKYYPLSETGIIARAIMLFSQLTNRAILTANMAESRYEVNSNGFGMDTVVKNFDSTNPIQIN